MKDNPDSRSEHISDKIFFLLLFYPCSWLAFGNTRVIERMLDVPNTHGWHSVVGPALSLSDLDPPAFDSLSSK